MRPLLKRTLWTLAALLLVALLLLVWLLYTESGRDFVFGLATVEPADATDTTAIAATDERVAVAPRIGDGPAAIGNLADGDDADATRPMRSRWPA